MLVRSIEVVVTTICTLLLLRMIIVYSLYFEVMVVIFSQMLFPSIIFARTIFYRSHRVKRILQTNFLKMNPISLKNGLNRCASTENRPRRTEIRQRIDVSFNSLRVHNDGPFFVTLLVENGAQYVLQALGVKIHFFQ